MQTKAACQSGLTFRALQGAGLFFCKWQLTGSPFLFQVSDACFRPSHFPHFWTYPAKILHVGIRKSVCFQRSEPPFPCSFQPLPSTTFQARLGVADLEMRRSSELVAGSCYVLVWKDETLSWALERVVLVQCLGICSLLHGHFERKPLKATKRNQGLKNPCRSGPGNYDWGHFGLAPL